MIENVFVKLNGMFIKVVKILPYYKSGNCVEFYFYFDSNGLESFKKYGIDYSNFKLDKFGKFYSISYSKLSKLLENYK